MKIIKTEDIHRILQETFPKSKIPNAIDNLKMGDLEGWDSLGNFNLLTTLQKTAPLELKLNQLPFFPHLVDIYIF